MQWLHNTSRAIIAADTRQPLRRHTNSGKYKISHNGNFVCIFLYTFYFQPQQSTNFRPLFKQHRNLTC